jgi:hypothetical protein
MDLKKNISFSTICGTNSFCLLSKLKNLFKLYDVIPNRFLDYHPPKPMNFIEEKDLDYQIVENDAIEVPSLLSKKKRVRHSTSLL